MQVVIHHNDPLPPPPPIREVVISLNYEEAMALRALLGQVCAGLHPLEGLFEKLEGVPNSYDRRNPWRIQFDMNVEGIKLRRKDDSK
jgi:hypothetical protein